MGDHLYTPPVDPRSFLSQFDTSGLGLDGAFAAGSSPLGDILLDSGTTACNKLREKVCAHMGIPYSASAEPADSALAGRSKVALVSERFVEPLVSAWRDAVTGEGLDATADANKHRKLLRKDNLPEDKRPPYAADPASLEEPAMVAALEATATLDEISATFASKFATVPLLHERRALSHVKTRNAISESEKHVTGKWRPAVDLVTSERAFADASAPCSVVFRVAIYHARDAGIRSEEFHVLGTNSLSDLRDRIFCSYTAAMFEAPPASSFFAIEGVLYSDDPACNPPARTGDGARGVLSRMLEEELQDSLEGNSSSAVGIVNWNRHALSQGRDHGWGVLQHAPMSVQLQDLKVRLGAHYVFSHFGGCEHIVVFLDMRAASDALDLSQEVYYPRKIHSMRRLKKRCQVCCRNFASFVTIGDPYAQQNPAYICTRCFDMLHCDEAGNLVTAGFDYIPYP